MFYNIQCMSETVAAVLFCFTKTGKDNAVLIKQTKLIIIQKTIIYVYFSKDTWRGNSPFCLFTPRSNFKWLIATTVCYGHGDQN